MAACSVSLKTDRAAKAGAIGVLIGSSQPVTLRSASVAATFQVPTLVITQADGNRIKAALAARGVNPVVVAS